jgi:hypothetical protein
MNVPTSETTLADSRLRNVDDLRGRQRLDDTGFDEISKGIGKNLKKKVEQIALEKNILGRGDIYEDGGSNQSYETS